MGNACHAWPHDGSFTHAPCTNWAFGYRPMFGDGLARFQSFGLAHFRFSLSLRF
jgi:hypothetical protein